MITSIILPQKHGKATLLHGFQTTLHVGKGARGTEFFQPFRGNRINVSHDGFRPSMYGAGFLHVGVDPRVFGQVAGD